MKIMLVLLVASAALILATLQAEAKAAASTSGLLYSDTAKLIGGRKTNVGSDTKKDEKDAIVTSSWGKSYDLNQPRSWVTTQIEGDIDEDSNPLFGTHTKSTPETHHVFPTALKPPSTNGRK